jgi:subtilisin family serine protease
VGGVGVAAGAEVVSFKVLNDRGSGSISGIIKAIDVMIDVAGVGDVANMSLGGGLSSALNDAVVKAASSAKKIRFAIAAGNESIDVDSTSPASAGNPELGIYVISAHDVSLKNSYFTNFDNSGGSDVDNVAFAAPGVGIYSLGLDGSMVSLSGTSMASPHAAGILLLGGFKAGTEFAMAYGGEQVDPLAVSSYWG